MTNGSVPEHPIVRTRRATVRRALRSSLGLALVVLLALALLPTGVLAAAAGWVRCAIGSPDICYTVGQVGIGTTDPSRVLHVQSDGQLEVEIEETRPGFAAHLYMRNPARSWLLFSDSEPDYFAIQDETQRLNRVVIDSEGNVGIGTSTPNSRLEVAAGYFELPTSDGIPPASDCDQPAEVGRMTMDSFSAALYVCSARGWVRK